MAFPASPTHGQTAVKNNISYTYNSSKGVWTKTGAVASASPVESVCGRTGAVTVTAADVGSGTFSGTFSFASSLTFTGTTSLASATVSGDNAITFGPNTSWGSYLKVGGNGVNGITRTNDIASLVTTNGNMHIDSGTTRAMYLNWYSGTGGIYFGNGSSGQAAYLSSAGALTLGSTAYTTSLGVGTAASGTTGEIRATNYITAFYSDKRLKTEIGKIENALDKIDQLCGVIYTQNELAESFGYNNYEEQEIGRAHV